MEREFIFNYNALDNYLNEHQKDPNRTDWELTMLRNNCKKYLDITKKDLKNFIISINDDTWDISINWQKNLQDKFDTLPTWYKMNKKSKLYRQVKFAMEEAKERWIYDQIFKEIREELDSLKETINPDL